MLVLSFLQSPGWALTLVLARGLHIKGRPLWGQLGLFPQGSAHVGIFLSLRPCPAPAFIAPGHLLGGPQSRHFPGLSGPWSLPLTPLPHHSDSSTALGSAPQVQVSIWIQYYSKRRKSLRNMCYSFHFINYYSALLLTSRHTVANVRGVYPSFTAIFYLPPWQAYTSPSGI